MANFTPTLAPIHEKSPFRFWCQKVLPTVYDDSLSYYELLTKVVYYLNENTQDLETVNSNVEALYNSYVELQNYVNNYFDQNFPELVAQRLDEMVEDGTFDAMLHTIVDPYFDLKSEEIDDAIEAQNEDIEILQNQWDNFIEHHAGLTTEDVIWTGAAFAKNEVIELEEPYNEYVYLDVYYAVSGSSACTVYRIPTDEITKVNGYRINHTYPAETTETDKTLITNSIVIKKVFVDPSALNPVIDFEKLQITSAGHWSWDGDSLNSATIQYEPEASQHSTFIAGTIWKIIGVKNEQNDAEVIDARTGYNGTVYQTLGQAIRTQVDDVYDAISATGISEAVKTALLNCFENVAWVNENGATYYNELEEALSLKTLASISAVYTQTGVVYDTDSLDSLKNNLVVTAYYDDLTSSVIPSGYTLSGELTVGTSTITVTYHDKTTTFNVTVTSGQLLYSLSNTQFTSTSQIDTGIKFESGNMYSVCVDFTPTSYPVSGDNYAVWGNKETASSGYAQLSTQKYTSGSNAGTYYYGVGIQWAEGKNIIAEGDRIRAVIVVDAQTDFDYTHHFRDITKGTSDTYTRASSESAICRAYNIYLGCPQNNTNLSFTGTLYDFKLFKRELSADEITAYLNGE